MNCKTYSILPALASGHLNFTNTNTIAAIVFRKQQKLMDFGKAVTLLAQGGGLSYFNEHGEHLQLDS